MLKVVRKDVNKICFPLQFGSFQCCLYRHNSRKGYFGSSNLSEREILISRFCTIHKMIKCQVDYTLLPFMYASCKGGQHYIGFSKGDLQLAASEMSSFLAKCHFLWQNVIFSDKKSFQKDKH